MCLIDIICGEILLFGVKSFTLQSESLNLAKLNEKLPDYFLGKTQLAGTIAFSSLFAILFLAVFVPFSNTAWTGLGNSGLFLSTVAFFIIAIALLSLSRVLMYYSRGWFRLTYLFYVIWCLLEIFLICVLYTVVTIFVLGPDSVEPSRALKDSFVYGTTALVIPYVISGMYLVITDNAKTIRRLTARSTVQAGAGGGKGADRISFFDVGGTLKLSLQSSNLYYIESDDNYVKVWYTDNMNSLRSRMIRCRLKTVEEQFSGTSLVRCNRKYIVNTDKVKVLNKEGSGYFLIMGNEDIPPIDVTKTYQADVLSRFS